MSNAVTRLAAIDQAVGHEQRSPRGRYQPAHRLEGARRDIDLAFTCQAAQDNPAQADPAVTSSPVNSGIAVTAGQTTTVDFL